MAKDFAQRGGSSRTTPARRRTRRGQRAPAAGSRRRAGPAFHGPSFSGGAVLGAALVLLAAYAPDVWHEPADAPAGAVPDAVEPNRGVRFEFEQRLRNAEVQADPGVYRTVATPPADGTEYLIQAASFQTATDAEKLRAELLLMNLPARTSRADLDNGAWYRVTVGPYPSQVEAQRALTRLRERALSAMLIKRKAG